MRRHVRPLLGIAIATGLGLLLTGCFLRGVYGRAVIVADPFNLVDHIIAAFDASSTLALCDSEGAYSECIYILDGVEIASTAYLLREFGVVGVLIDPVIAQVPDDVHTITATYDLGSGPQPLVVAPVSSFKVTHNISVTAEPGHAFLILELPSAVEDMVPTGVPTNGLPISYTLTYVHDEPLGTPVPPQTIKLMLAGRVEINGHKYYVPMLPCVTDFAPVPSLTLPESPTLQDLEPAVGALPAQACNNQVYFFEPEPPLLDLKVYLPLALR